MIVLTPPQSLNVNHNIYKTRIFLAGSIEMGKAEEWQQKAIDFLNNFTYHTLSNPRRLEKYEGIIYNPRRNDWDSSWKQELENPQFYQQVNWELNALENSTHILYYFAPNTLSPISLLELGKFSSTDKKIVVVADKEYQRKGNIDIFCEKYKIPQYDTLQIGLSRLLRS